MGFQKQRGSGLQPGIGALGELEVTRGSNVGCRDHQVQRP